MKLTHTILALFAAVLALPMAAAGPAEEEIENIVVIGQKSKASLRRDVFQSEETFYALYNTLNDDNEYDVRCFYEAQTGTRVKNHVCRAKFVTNAYAGHAARNRGDLTRVANQSAIPAIAEKKAKFQEKLETLIAANPELQAALVRYNTARAQFMAEREKSANN